MRAHPFAASLLWHRSTIGVEHTLTSLTTITSTTRSNMPPFLAACPMRHALGYRHSASDPVPPAR